MKKVLLYLSIGNEDKGGSSSGKSKGKGKGKEAFKDGGSTHTKPRKFRFLELAIATENFAEKNFLGSGGFGNVYRGHLESTNQIVAVKMLDHNGIQGNKEFIVEALMLQLLNHSNVVKLIGYCDENDQRLLVYEHMALGSLEHHLYAFGMATRKRALDWSRRMNIAAGAAKGLEYLHDKASPPVIYRDFKCSNILLDEKYNPKLSDFGLAKFGPAGNRTHVSSRLMGTMGYVAPDVVSSGQLTFQADVYSFGVVLLELITGKRAVDVSETPPELVLWAQTYFNDRTRFTEMADPLLQGQYSMRSLYHAIAVAVMCLHADAAQRPPIADVVTCLSYLASKNLTLQVLPTPRNRI